MLVYMEKSCWGRSCPGEDGNARCRSDKACCFMVQDKATLSGFDGNFMSISLPQQLLESISSFLLHLLCLLLFPTSSSSVSLYSIFHLCSFFSFLCFEMLSCSYSPPSVLLISVHILVHNTSGIECFIKTVHLCHAEYHGKEMENRETDRHYLKVKIQLKIQIGTVWQERMYTMIFTCHLNIHDPGMAWVNTVQSCGS